MIEVEVLAGTKTNMGSVLSRMKSSFKKLEKAIGVWPYDFIKAFFADRLTDSMEYAGAFRTDDSADVFHEMMHSYFARGVYPVDGNSEWFDEFIASGIWDGIISISPRTWGLPGIDRMRHPVSGFSPYQQGLVNCPHHGAPMLAWNKRFIKQGGILPFLRHVFAKYVYKTISTEQIKQELEAFYGQDVTDLFENWVFSKGK